MAWYVHISRLIRQFCKSMIIKIFTRFRTLKQKDEINMPSLSAGKRFAQVVQAVYGPIASNKMVINHIDELSIGRIGTIIPELIVDDPAVKVMINLSRIQEDKVVGGTNFVIIFSGALLEAAEELLKMGLSCQQIIEGYNVALQHALEILNTLCIEINNDEKPIRSIIKNSCNSSVFEQYEHGIIHMTDFDLISKNANIELQFIQDYRKLNENTKLWMKNNILVYACSLDEFQFLKLLKESGCFKEAEYFDNMLFYMDMYTRMFAVSDIDVVISLGRIDKYVLWRMEKFHIIAVGLVSKFDLCRISRAVGAEAGSIYALPEELQIGTSDSVTIDNIKDTSVAIFQLKNENSGSRTIIVRNAAYDDNEDGLDNIKIRRFVPGAGATEIELASQITSFAGKCPGLNQPSKLLQSAVKKFAGALEVFPKSLAENIGADPDEMVAKLYAAHKEGKKNFGISLQGENSIINAVENNFLDWYTSKYWGLQHSVAAVTKILELDCK